ncbi:Arginine decarboxylase [Thalictrum thalictroides]|uniref:Arginine decarboxylase n=2 Tax=Thalictrum thalictroides TaxID=46969 RepID=A0A7J6V6S9_THATH|nr:Arginine decarboxylase [Thalictrum thalictroides]
MPALACCVDAATIPPGYALTGDSYLPLPETFSGNFPGTNITTTIPTSNHPSILPSLWSPSLSESLYKINGWGAPYFSVNSTGNISVHPHGLNTLPHQEIDLMKVVKKVSEPKSTGGLGLPLPLIVRLPDVLKNRLESLQYAFDSAIKSQGYDSHYQGVYPVKCNQDRFIVEDVVEFGSAYRFGLEAGSKPELLLAMSCLCKGSPDALLICNGYKDAEYISLALVARKLHLNTVIVLEQEEELDLVIDISRKLDVRPVIGMRAKLRTKHAGHFGATSGEKGKFGLTTMQILRVAKKLEKARMLDCLQLLHFHIGSQIPTTELLADGVSEATQIYCELVRLGAGMKVIDVGGGLGIDYDGSHSANSDNSVGYGLEEYASMVVQAIRFACDRKLVKHPVICSESGRALVSHHSILIFEAVSATAAEAPSVSSLGLDLEYFVEGLTDEARADYHNLTTAATQRDFDTCLVHANQLKNHCVEEFKEGNLDLEHLAAVDGLCEILAKAMGAFDSVRTYHVNLSVFTSIPDFWGIGQQFPIVPIHKLDQRPGVKGVLSDLTCDSDGKVDKFISGESSLPLHELEGKGGSVNGVSGGGGYYLGMFLGGAYQEALGGLHNLFGGPSVVRVSQSDGPHSFAVTRAVPGLSCAEVLRVMQHEPEFMFETLKHRVEECGHGGSSEDEQDVEEEDEMARVTLVSGLARSFHNMPYLATTTTCSSYVSGGGFCYQEYCNDDNNNNNCSAVVGGGDDEQQWTYCCA